jgi:hypothetical protein
MLPAACQALQLGIWREPRALQPASRLRMPPGAVSSTSSNRITIASRRD